MKIALLGSGVMGSAVLASMVRADGVTQVVVADLRAEVARSVAAAYADAAPEVTGTDDPSVAVAGSDVVVLAVKPQHMAAAVEQIREHVGESTVVISIAVGLTTAWFASRLPSGTAVVRVMPNTPATIGKGVSAISAGAQATDDHLALTEALFAQTGLVVRVPEDQQSAVAAISGSGPAYVFAMIDALAEAGTALGLPRALALQLASHTAAGAGEFAAESDQHPALLREAVSSPGGTTLAALAELDDRAVRAAYAAAVRAATRRADELAAALS